MKVLKAIGKYVWGIAAAILAVLAAIIAFDQWRKRGRVQRSLAETASELAASHVETVKATNDVKARDRSEKALGELREAYRKAAEEADRAALDGTLYDILSGE